MREIVYGSKFKKSAAKLENRELKRLAMLMKLLREDTHHLLLHTKHLTGPLEGLLAFRIGRDHRCIFQIIDSKTILFFEVCHRKDIYKK